MDRPVRMTALLGVVAFAASAPTALAQEAWRAFALPALCEPSQAPARIARLERGHHVLLDLESPEVLARPEPALLPVPDLLSLLATEAARARQELRVVPGAPPLLVRGDDAALEQVRATLGDLERLSAALEVELRAWWLPGAAPLPAWPDPAAATRAIGAVAPLGVARSRSGSTVDLGVRRERSFLGSYWVEVATDAGAPDPRIGRVASGRTVHLSVARVRGGRGVHISGLVDLAEEAAQAEFDTGTIDLGILQVPSVEALQVAFSGTVDSGGFLAVSVQGRAPFDGVLLVQASTRPDPEGPARWRGFDVALVGTDQYAWPAPRPWEESSGGAELARRREGLASSALAQLADEAGRGAESKLSSLKSKDSRGAPVWMPGLLLLPATETAAIGEVESLIAVIEGTLCAGSAFDVQHGTARVRGPLSEGGWLRVLSVRESTALVDIDVEIAQESWMPVPRVERTLAGFSLEGGLSAGFLESSGWSAAQAPVTVLSRDQAGLAALELFDRSLRSASARVGPSEPRELLPEGAPLPALRVGLEPRR